MALTKVSDDVMVLGDPTGMQTLRGFAIVFVLILAIAAFQAPEAVVALIPIILLMLIVGLVMYSKTKLTLDKKTGKLTIERSTLTGSKTITLPLDKIARIKMAALPSGRINYYLDFLDKGGSSIAKGYIHPNDADAVALFLGVPLEKPK